MHNFIQTNGITLHYLEKGGADSTVVLMHGLTANAHAFSGLLAAGLPYRTLSVDLRGRGQSEAPATGYSMADHAADMLGLLDALGLDQVVLGGHSFGGLVAIYTAVTHPDRVSRCIIMDSGPMHPNVRELIAPSMARLGRTYPSWEAYCGILKAAQNIAGDWDEHMEAYFRADVRLNEDGTVSPIPNPAAIAEAAAKGLDIDWLAFIRQIPQPTLILNGPRPYGAPDAPAIIPRELAAQTAALIPDGTLVEIPGNHVTMLFGDNAALMAQAITAFIG